MSRMTRREWLATTRTRNESRALRTARGRRRAAIRARAAADRRAGR